MEKHATPGRKIKIAYVINTIVEGGPSNVILNIIQSLDRSRFIPFVILIFEENHPYTLQRLEAMQVQVIHCAFAGRMQALLKGHNKLDEIMEKEGIDIYHSHGFVPDLIGARMKSKCKKITTVHNMPFEDYRYEYGRSKGFLFATLHLLGWRRYDKVIFCAEWIYELFRARMKNASYINNGISAAAPSPTDRKEMKVSRATLHIPEDATVFLYIGRLCSRKNVIGLVKDFHQVHKDKEYLLLIGEGEDEAECKKVEDHNILYLGFRTDTADFLQLSDIYVSASLTEGLSISVLEALSAGMGLFLSDIPSHRAVIRGQKEVFLGYVFNHGNFASQFEKMRSMRSRLDRRKIKELQQRFYSADRMSEEYQCIYERI